jgi:hypothetical protein
VISCPSSYANQSSKLGSCARDGTHVGLREAGVVIVAGHAMGLLDADLERRRVAAELDAQAL